MRSFFLGLCLLPLCLPAPAHADSSRYCREYTSSVNVGGQVQQSYGTACLQPDGSWEVVSEATPPQPVEQVVVVPTVVQREVQYVRPQPFYGTSHAYYSPSYFSISFGSRDRGRPYCDNRPTHYRPSYGHGHRY